MKKRIDWSVGLEFAGDPGEHELDALMDSLDAHGGSVSGGTVGKTFGVRIATTASTARDAAERAEHIVRVAATFEAGDVVAIDVKSFDHLIAENRGVDMNALVGVSDIAKAHGFSRQRAHELSRLSGFPQPVAALTAGRVWRLVDVERFLATPRAPGRRRKTAAPTVRVARAAERPAAYVAKSAARRPAAKSAAKRVAPRRAAARKRS